MSYATSGRLGVDFTKTYTDGLFPFSLGAQEVDNNGVVYRFCRATAAKTAGIVYILDDSFTVGGGITSTLASAAPVALCVPQTTTVAPDSGQTYADAWYATHGPLSVFDGRGGTTSADVELYTTATAGIIDSYVTGVTAMKRIDDLKWTATPTSSALSAAFASRAISIPTDLGTQG